MMNDTPAPAADKIAVVGFKHAFDTADGQIQAVGLLELFAKPITHERRLDGFREELNPSYGSALDERLVARMEPKGRANARTAGAIRGARIGRP
jgi:hypothetical protein